MAGRDPAAVWLTKRKGKKGVSYGLRWICPATGKCKSEACGRNLAFARERRAQIRQALREGALGKIPETTIEAFVERLPDLMVGRAESTITKTQESLRLLDKLCKVRRLSAITRAVVMDFRAKRMERNPRPRRGQRAQVAPATVNKDLRQIKSALSYAEDAGLLKVNPLLRWKGLMLPEPEKQVRVVEADEFGKLMEACENPTYRALLIVAYRAGLRRNTLANLRWAAVDLESGSLHVVNVPEAGELTKSRKIRAVPMHPDVLSVLTAMHRQARKVVAGGEVLPKDVYVFTWPNGERFKADWISHEFSRLVKRAGIAHATLHDLRRSFSTIAQRCGVDKYVVKDLGGWSDVSVVEKHYTGDVSEVHRAAMRKIAAAVG